MRKINLMKMIFTIPLALSLVATIVQADTQDLTLTSKNLQNWSTSSVYDVSLRGRTFYDQAGQSGAGDYLLKVNVNLTNGVKLIFYQRAANDGLHALKRELQETLNDIKENKIVFARCPGGEYHRLWRTCAYQRFVDLTYTDEIENGRHEITSWSERLEPSL